MKTSANLGIPRTTLRQWAGRAKSDTASPKQVPASAYEAQTGKLGAKFLEIADKGTELQLSALSTVDPSKLTMREVKDLATAAAIAVDKHQLLMGGPQPGQERVVRIIYGVDSSIGSLRELGERTVSGTPSLPPVLEGSFAVSGADKSA